MAAHPSSGQAVPSSREFEVLQMQAATPTAAAAAAMTAPETGQPSVESLTLLL
jgi:hypothetical protein